MYSLRYVILSLLVVAVIICIGVTAFSDDGASSPRDEGQMMVRTDEESILKGKELFAAKCGFCHKTNSTEKLVGPGLKGILKGERILVSKKPATPENIVDQMKNPYQNMPSFSYLSDEEIHNIIAYLNTL